MLKICNILIINVIILLKIEEYMNKSEADCESVFSLSITR